MNCSRRIRTLISFIVSIATIVYAISIPVYAADTQISTYWTVANTTAQNTAKLSDVYAYSGSKSIHMVHASGDSTALTLKPNWTAPIINIPQKGIIQNFLTFYAKGTLPQSGEIQLYSSCGNGITFADGNTTFTVGDAANGWKKVDVFETYYNTTTLTGGILNTCELRILGDCDFYMDSVEYHVAKHTVKWEHDSDQPFFTDQDPSFETGDITEYNWDNYSYNDSDEIPQGYVTFSNANWTVGGATSDNYVTCSPKYAYSGTKSAHIVHSDGTNTELKMLPYFTDGESIRSDDLKHTANFKVVCELSFYAKGHLPESGSFKINTSNGRMHIEIDASEWEKSVPDTNGWYIVTGTGETPVYTDDYLKGVLDGYQNYTGFHITGDCNFYIDDISVTIKSYHRGGLNKTIYVLEDRNPGFEAVDSTEYTLNFYPANAAGTGMQTNAQKVNSFGGVTASSTTNFAGRVTVPESIYGSTGVSMYLAIYKDGNLYSVINKPVNSTTNTAGTQCFDLIASVPANMANGVYTSKLLVWRDSDYLALSRFAEITE